MLKRYTNYRCRVCNKYQHYTGDGHFPDSLADDTHCGRPLTEDVPGDSLWTVSFEMVSSAAHPEFYQGPDGARSVSCDQVPESAWSLVTRETRMEHDAKDQVAGLRSFVSQGELIRNVKLLRADLTVPVEVPEEE